MNNNIQKPFGTPFFILALSALALGLIGGLLAAITYVVPDFLIQYQGLSRLRPLHVSFVMFWIIIGAQAAVYFGITSISSRKPISWLYKCQWCLWFIALCGVMYSYLNGNFGGREYWEFPPVWALPIALACMLFLIQFFYLAKGVQKWPVYVWMWMTGICFFLFIFLENYLWLFPFFRAHFITDMTLQWKVNGSLVGAINQMLYGVAFFLMDKISGTNEHKVGSSKLAFTMYFLGLANLMFNWGHHIYALPTASYIRIVGYAVSMTEWIFFVKIIYNWRKSIQTAKLHYPYFPYRFIMASDFWVFVNMTAACFMSIPVFNIYTHGTHVTVAHAMGTTIGINSMILLAAVFMFLELKLAPNILKVSVFFKRNFWLLQAALLLLFLALNISGLIKGYWLNKAAHAPFSAMMLSLKPYFILFLISGVGLFIALYNFIIYLFKNLFKKI